MALPTEESVRLALRTQQLIAFETGVADAVDPLGGSFMVESLTDALEARAAEFMAKIDAMGGAVKAIEAQYYQTEIAESAYRYQRAIESKEKVIVGVNEFVVEEPPVGSLFRVDERVRDDQAGRLRALRAKRDATAVQNALQSLEDAARGLENLMPALITAVEAYATLGEISDVLRKVWGEYA